MSQHIAQDISGMLICIHANYKTFIAKGGTSSAIYLAHT